VLPQAAAPLQMLINQESMDQGAAIQSFAKSLLGGATGATQSIDAGSANPLTGTATTAPAPVQVWGERCTCMGCLLPDFLVQMPAAHASE
jgi:hypothetical protein